MNIEKPILPVANKIERVTINDLRPMMFKPGETQIVLQRNAEDNRKPDASVEFGQLFPEAAEKARSDAKVFFEQLFMMIGEEVKDLNILVVATDTKLNMPVEDKKSTHKRAVETADQVIKGLKEAMERYSLPEDQLLNKDGRAYELSSGRLNDLKMLDECPQFVQFLKDKYGKEFWVAYETDKEREIRLRMGAEGPKDIADRVDSYLKVVAKAAKSYVEMHPQRRMVVWAVSHYDSISPYIKRHVINLNDEEFHDQYLKVDHGTGIVMVTNNEDSSSRTTIQGRDFEFSLRK